MNDSYALLAIFHNNKTKNKITNKHSNPFNIFCVGFKKEFIYIAILESTTDVKEQPLRRDTQQPVWYIKGPQFI